MRLYLLTTNIAYNSKGSFVHTIISIGKDSLDKAERWQVLSKNVVDLVDRPKAVKEEMQVRDNEQSLTFLEVRKNR
ncbi:hypothetical protein YSY22_10100 [Brevibacillus formosus]